MGTIPGNFNSLKVEISVKELTDMTTAYDIAIAGAKDLQKQVTELTEKLKAFERK